MHMLLDIAVSKSVIIIMFMNILNFKIDLTLSISIPYN